MKAGLVIAAVAFQILVLGYMIAEREIVIHAGQRIYLRTMPVDPRDIFRGDYVRLDYEISRMHSELWKDGLKKLSEDSKAREKAKKDMPVYVGLKLDEGQIGVAESITDQRPAKGMFIRGRVEEVWTRAMNVRYGIEAYFVQQGKGLELERGRVREDRVRAPLEMEVALSRSGLAVLRGYRWCRLGISLTIDSDKDRVPVSAVLGLYNASDRPLAIVDLPGGRSFTLEPDTFTSWEPEDWRWVEEGTPRPAVADEHIRVLQPGETAWVTIQFSDSAWFIRKKGEPARSLSDREIGRRRHRFVYRPPSREQCAQLRNTELIWHGRLHSSAFTGGRVD